MKRKREIIKRVIAYMTLGIDVSRLFTDMIMVGYHYTDSVVTVVTESQAIVELCRTETFHDQEV